MKRILFAIHQDSFFTGLFGIANRFRETGEYEPRVYFPKRYPGRQRDIERCRRAGVAVVGDTAGGESGGEGGSATPPADLIARVRGAVLRRLPESAVRAMYYSLPSELRLVRNRIAQVRRLIRKERADLLVLGGDIVHYDTAAFIKAAHDEGVPAVVVAGWMIHQDENAEAFRFDPALHLDSIGNRVAARLYPRWVYEYKGQKLLRLPAARRAAREWFGIAPPRPWTLHSGAADAIAVECEATREACLREGLPPAQIHVTGTINHDVMAAYMATAAERKRELCAELGLTDPERPLLLCGLPPNEFYRIGGRPECDFTTHEQVSEFWLQTIAEAQARGWNVVVCLHPSLLYEAMKPLERFGPRITRRHTAEAISVCDLFVVSNSTTIQWATASGKPVINYDVYKYRQNDYAEITGMVTVEEQGDFREAVRRATEDPAYYAELVAKQAACRERWGVLDGHAGDRMAALFEELMAKYEGQRA